MAYAGNSRHQSRLAREMARDLGRNDHSIASSTGSHHGSVSSDDSWDPENEAECSTGRKFPELRDTAKKYGKWNPHATDKDNTDNYYLDTSAIGRAFPDFTQGLDSEDTSVLSVEDGRGAKPGNRQRVPSSRIVRQEYSDNVDAVVNVSNYRVMGTPPLADIKSGAQNGKQISRQQALRAEGRGSVRSTPQKENIAPQAPPSSGRHQKNYISGATRSANGEQRRTIADLQAGVADDSDGSFISDERPATVTISKSSRFAQPRASPLAKIQNISKPTLASTLAAKRPLNRDTPKKVAEFSASPSPATRYGSIRKPASSTNQTTEQSFLIPNADAFSVIGGGSPAPNKSALGSSRFGGGSGRPSGTGHNKIDSVPVPTDEKAIFLSLQLLQDKVSSMENEKSNDARHIKQLEEANYNLEIKNEELERRRRSDSALGDSGSEAEKMAQNKLQRLLENQKKDLDAQVAEQNKTITKLQNALQEKEDELSQMNEERNNAVATLEEAYGELDRFEQDNIDLRKENAQLKREQTDLIQENSQMKAQLSRLGKETEENTKRWNSKEEDFRTQLKEIVAVPDVQLREENANLKTRLTRINTDFANVQKQLEQLNKALSKETARAENLENQTRQFNMKEAELREKLVNETNRRTELENATRMMENKTVEFKSQKESDLRAKLDEEIKRRFELEATTRQALIKENELRDRLDNEINRRAKGPQGQNKTEQMIREEVTREFMMQTKELTQKIERREKAINKVRGLMDEITAQGLPPTKTRRQRSASQPQPVEREATRTLPREQFNVDVEDFSIPPMNKSVQETDDQSDDGSFAMDTTQTIHKDINVTANGHKNRQDQDTQSTNFSDICGPGVMQAMRDGAAYARFRKAEIDAGRPDPEDLVNMHNATMNGQNDTMASVRTARSARSNKSGKAPVGILKRGEADDTMRSMMSQKSVRHDDTMRSAASQRSYRRHSVPEIPRVRADNGKANATVDLTFAYLVPDIAFATPAAAGPSTSARAEPLSENAKSVLNKLCQHDSGNCTMCTRIATYDKDGMMIKQTVTVKRPVAISTLERGPDATIRPSMAPGKALAKVLKGLEDELAHMNLGHAGLQRAYFALDAKADGKNGKMLEDKLVMSLKAIQRKRKQIYDLGDVVEGMKETGLEMTQSEIEVTLVGLGLDREVLFADTQKAAKQDTVTGRYFEEGDASWAGIEESTQ